MPPADPGATQPAFTLRHLLLGLAVLTAFGLAAVWAVTRALGYLARETRDLLSGVTAPLGRIDPLDTTGVAGRFVVLGGDTVGTLLFAFAIEADTANAAAPEPDDTPAKARAPSAGRVSIRGILSDPSARLVYLGRLRAGTDGDLLRAPSALSGRLPLDGEEPLYLDTVPAPPEAVAEVWFATGLKQGTIRIPLVVEAPVE